MNSNILVVEDEAAISRVLVKILAEAFDTYEIEAAYDGQSAIEMIQNKDYAFNDDVVSRKNSAKR